VERNFEPIRRGNHRRQSDGKPRDLSRNREIPLEVRRRNRQHIRKVVEAAVCRFISRQLRRDVHVEREEIADRIGVLDAVEAMHSADATGIRMREPRRIDGALERRGGRVVGGNVRSRQSRWRHRARAQLRDDALPEIRAARRRSNIHRVERQPRCTQALVMTGDAVLVENGLDGCACV
jgi:hypothetical protein